jgi:ketosteroid isomerase-like protein
MSERSVEVVEAVIDAWNRRDLESILERMHPSCEVRPAEVTETLHGHDGVVAAFRDWFDAFEEFSIQTENVVVRGDRTLVAMRQRARGKGSALEVEQRFYQLFVVREGRVVRFEEFSEEADGLAALEGGGQGL